MEWGGGGGGGEIVVLLGPAFTSSLISKKLIRAHDPLGTQSYFSNLINFIDTVLDIY